MPTQKVILRKNSSKKVSVFQDPTETRKKEVLDRLVSSQTNREPESVYSQYFDHLGGKCLCALCNCGKHKCHGQYCSHKPSLHNNQTQYQREFVPKTPEQGHRVNHNFFDQIKQEGDVGKESTYKHDYPGYISQMHLSKANQKPTTSGVPFSGMSTYQNMYLNWGMGDTAQIYPQNNPTVIKDLPFMGKSVYKDSYQGTKAPPAVSTKGMNNPLKSPLSPPDMKFDAVSITKSSYQPFRINKLTEQKQKSKVELNPSFKGQYNTQYIKEYDQKSLKPCPAKEVLNEFSRYE